MSEYKEAVIEDIISTMKKNSWRADTKLIMRAYEYAKTKHGDQLRRSGEPYIIHPVQVAYTLATLSMDENTICAALLHDVLEDTDTSKEDLEHEFNKEIAEMVDGVTKLGKLSYTSVEEQQVENYRKMFLAMGKDIRVILIKLADRLHNMRTLKYLTRDRQIANAKETMNLYAPLANRLGVYSLKWELEDLSFKYLHPEEYREIVEGINKKREERLKFIDMIMDQIKVELKKQKIVAEVNGRAKHLYSIYRKMKRDNLTLDQVYDLFALRIIVNSVKDCYAALGVVHDLYNPMPGRFKDYIAMPKPNMYQSLHTTLIGPKGTPFEVQIRTWDMHRIAEYGIAAHWAYKEKSFSSGKKANVKVEEDKLSWIRETLEWQKDMQDPEEFMQTLKKELKKIGMKHDDLFRPEFIGAALERYKFATLEDMYASVGFGSISSGKIVARTLEEYRKVHHEENLEKTLEELSKEKVHKEKPSNNGVVVKGIDNCLVKLSKCCNPVPGDEIVGYITKGRGVSVHRADCVNMKSLISEENRIIDVYWYTGNKTTYDVDIEVYANDRAGLLADIINEMNTTKCKLIAVSSRATKEKIAITEMTIEVENIEELNKVLKSLRRIDSVYEVKRKK